MSRPFILSTPASVELDAILTYVLENSAERRAQHVAERFQRAFQMLAENPGLGHRREDIAPPTVHFFAVWSSFIIDKPNTNPLHVAHVVHGARDVRTLLRDEAL